MVSLQRRVVVWQPNGDHAHSQGEISEGTARVSFLFCAGAQRCSRITRSHPRAVVSKRCFCAQGAAMRVGSQVCTPTGGEQLPSYSRSTGTVRREFPQSPRSSGRYRHRRGQLPEGCRDRRNALLYSGSDPETWQIARCRSPRRAIADAWPGISNIGPAHRGRGDATRNDDVPIEPSRSDYGGLQRTLRPDIALRVLCKVLEKAHRQTHRNGRTGMTICQ